MENNKQVIAGQILDYVFAVDPEQKIIPGRFIQLSTEESVIFEPDIADKEVVTVAGIGMNIWPFTVVLFNPESFAHVSNGQTVSYEGGFSTDTIPEQKH